MGDDRINPSTLRPMPSPSCWRSRRNDIDAAFRGAVGLAQGLFPHQIEGVAFLLGRKRAILADDMGLGKTRQAIVALRHVAPNGALPCRVPGVGEAQLGAGNQPRRA